MSKSILAQKALVAMCERSLQSYCRNKWCVCSSYEKIQGDSSTENPPLAFLKDWYALASMLLMKTLQCLSGPQPMKLIGLCVLDYADILHCKAYGLSLLLK